MVEKNDKRRSKWQETFAPALIEAGLLRAEAEPGDVDKLAQVEIDALAALRPDDLWVIRVRLQIKHCKRDLAMFNLAIDSKLRGCDLVSRVDDIALRGHVRDRATIVQHKSGRPFRFKVTEQTHASLQDCS